MAIRKISIVFAVLICSVALLAVMGQLSLSGSDGSSGRVTGALTELADRAPSDAWPVASQADIDALPDGANAVLTSDVSKIVLSRPVSLYGDGHRAGAVTLAADGVRVSGLIASSVVVNGNGCTIDRCTVKS